MECPRCQTEVAENQLSCPNCKKVLKLVCPKCKTINKSNTCKKCGFVIVSKCHNCGKINQTINGKCSSCGFSTYTSVAINSSNIDEFACITMEFPNIDKLKPALGSSELFQKFKNNLNKSIQEYAGSIGISREIIEDIYVIRFNKDFSFKQSCISAMKASLKLAELIAGLNFKIEKFDNFQLECKIAVLKRDINSKPDEYKSGFNIKEIGGAKKEKTPLSNLQIITDSSIYEKVCDEFSLKSLSTSYIKNQMVMFFELNLKKHLKIEKPTEKKEEEHLPVALPEIQEKYIEEDIEENRLYDINSITFDELKCRFETENSATIKQKLLQEVVSNPKKIIVVKGKYGFHQNAKGLTSLIEQKYIYKNFYRITCHEGMKYKPYGFFTELISSMHGFSINPKSFGDNPLNILAVSDNQGVVSALLNLQTQSAIPSEDARNLILNIFSELFASMQNTMILIENIDNIDDTSYEILQLFIQKFQNFGISYIITGSKSFALHKKVSQLLSDPNYLEIRLKPCSIKELLTINKAKYAKIADSYYMQTICQNANGSYLYVKNAIDYLVERELLKVEEREIVIEKTQSIIIPPTLDELTIKRLTFMRENAPDNFKMFSYLILLGPMTDVQTLKYLDIEKGPEILKILNKNRYIFSYNNFVCIHNFETFKKLFLKTTPIELQKQYAQDLLNNVFSTPTRHPTELLLNQILGKEKDEFKVLEQLSSINASMGDFSAYLQCSLKLLKLLDNNVNEDSDKTITDYKLEVYENISNLLYKYAPTEIYNISKTILADLEKKVDDKKVKTLCNKMLQGCLIGGNFSYALELSNKILSTYKNAKLNPSAENFSNSMFLVTLIKIEILFSIGNFKECKELGEEILSYLTIDDIRRIKPENLTEKDFLNTIYDSLVFSLLSKILLLETQEQIQEFDKQIQEKFGELPEYFKLAIQFTKILRNKPTDNVSLNSNDKFSKIFYYIIKAFSEREDYRNFANDIYQAKIVSKLEKLTQIEYFCDLMIGFSYSKLNETEKASSIYYNVVELCDKNGLKAISDIAWYLIAVLKINQNELDIAFGIANNETVQLEKNPNCGDYLFFLFRVMLAYLYEAKGDAEASEACAKSATFIKEKYELV